MRYVLGFLTGNHNSEVVLIRKTKPEWQEGFLNGVGGKIEEGEEPGDAMRREFREEAGLDILSWRHYATMRGPDWEVFVFRAQGDLLIRTMTEEWVDIYPIDNLHRERTLSNVPWLVAMAVDRNLAERLAEPVIIHYV